MTKTKKIIMTVLVLISIVLICTNYYNYTIGNDPTTGRLVTEIDEQQYETFFNVTQYKGIDITLAIHDDQTSSYIPLGGYTFINQSTLFDLFNNNHQEHIYLKAELSNKNEPIVYLEDMFHSFHTTYSIPEESISNFDYSNYIQIDNSATISNITLQQPFELTLLTLQHQRNGTTLQIKASLR